MSTNTQAVTRDGLYPVCDFAPEAVALGADDRRNLRAQWTGEPRRAIKPGEWFLSGASVAAYRAGSASPGVYHPARLVVAVPMPTVYSVQPLPRVPVPASAL